MSVDKSVLDKNFKHKKAKVKFKYIDFKDPACDKYFKQSKYLTKFKKWIHEYTNGEIVVDVDNDKFAGDVTIGNEKKDEGFIMISVEKPYRGYGLGKQLMKDAINKYGGIDLVVYKDNEIAIKLYKDLGFKVIKDLKEKNQYWMKLESEIKESINDTLNKLNESFCEGNIDEFEYDMLINYLLD